MDYIRTWKQYTLPHQTFWQVWGWGYKQPEIRLFFSWRVLIFSLFLNESICCGHSLEVPRKGNWYIWTGHFCRRQSAQKVTTLHECHLSVTGTEYWFFSEYRLQSNTITAYLILVLNDEHNKVYCWIFSIGLKVHRIIADSLVRT